MLKASRKRRKKANSIKHRNSECLILILSIGVLGFWGWAAMPKSKADGGRAYWVELAFAKE